MLLVAALGFTAHTATAANRGHHPRPRRETHRRVKRPVAHASIIGGQIAKIGTFSWLAKTFYADAEGLYGCTGTVVAPSLILTAAHCAENTETGIVNDPSGYVVVTGNVDWAAAERQVSRVSQVIVYPYYEPSGLLEGWGDAALLVLSTPTTAAARRVALIRPGRPDACVKEFSTVTGTSGGQFRTRGMPSSCLSRAANVW